MFKKKFYLLKFVNIPRSMWVLQVIVLIYLYADVANACSSTKNPEDYSVDSKTINNVDLTSFMAKDKRVIRVLPYKGEHGLYKLSMTLQPCPMYKGTLNTEVHTCFYYIKPLPPLTVLYGGISRTVPEHEQVVLHAEDSLDLDEPLDEFNVNTLKFMWSCTQKIGTTLCRDELLGQTRFQVIPEEYVVKDEVFNITLEVTSSRSLTSSAFQEIRVQPNAIMLSLTCEKNCPPVTDAPNVQFNTYISALCETQCREDHLEWEIKPVNDSIKFNFNYKQDTQFGRTGSKFVINKDVLQAATDYYISVKFNDGTSGSAKMIVKYAVLPVVESCEVKPPSGISLHTWFTLHCVEAPPPNKNNFYQLFVDAQMNEYVVNGYYPDVFRIKFLLPPSKDREFKVRVAKGSGPAIFLKVNPNVKAATDGKTLVESLDIYKRFINGSNGLSVSQLLISHKPEDKEEGIKMFQALVNEVITNEPTSEMHEFAQKMTRTIVEELVNSPPEHILQLVTMSDSITKILKYHNLAESDPLLAKFASKLCSKMIESHAEEIKRQKFPLNSEAQFNKVGNVLTKCMEANVRENFDLIRPVTLKITISQLDMPPIDGPVVSEDYANYVDFDEIYGKQLENLNDVTSNVIDSTATAAKSLALVTASGEHFARTSGKYSATLVAKDKGKNLALTKIELLDVILIPSHDFDKNQHQFDILMSTWSKDLMWWNPKKTRAMTNILSVQFWHSSCKKRIKHFRSPVNVLMNMIHSLHFNTTVVQSNVSVPDEYTSMFGENLNPYIRVHRINIFAESVLHINFKRESFLDVFDVVLTKFQFPSSVNFVVNETIDDEDYNHYLRIINYESYDIWGYLAILPSKRHGWHNRSRLMDYKVNFSSSFCMRWLRRRKVWKPSCKPGLATTLKIINCECLHFSVLAGYLQNAESIVQEFSPIEILLNLYSWHIIFITLAITLGVYCLLLISIASNEQLPVYYLSDNSKDDLYGYLVVVRTENKRNAGTTSIVTMRLTGTRSSSDAHVLNYPDPKLRLLQKQGEDVFFLSTPQHLGKIKGLELWYDCTGPNPSWYCRDVLVYDLQKSRQWYFRVKTKFDVNKGVSYLVTFPTEFNDTRRIFSRLRICNHFHTWELWAMEHNFSFVARLTVVFSNVLFIYSTFLMLLGVPSLELRDAFDPYETFYISFDNVSMTLQVALISFVIHIVIAWIFRFSSNTEYFVCKRKVRNRLDCTIFCWVLLGLLIGSSISFLVLFGFWVPFFSSLVWLTCCLIAIVFQITVLENLFIIVQAFVCNFRLTIAIENRASKILKYIETQRLELHTQLGATLMRNYMTHLYKPLKALQITKRRIVGSLRISICNDLEDLIMYGIYNLILYMIILVNKGGLITISKKEVISLVEGEHTRTLPFSKIRSVTQVYQYLNDTLIPTMQPTTWYENYSIADAGLMIDNANKYIGIARLRQQRQSTPTCVIPELVKFLNITCWPEFTFGYGEYGTFGYQWGKFQQSDEYDRLKDIYYYQTEKETRTHITVGTVAMYTGGGYVAFLGRHLYNSYANLLMLFKGLWLDHRTRSIFIEFLVYNANYNVFVAVSLLYEYSAAGFAVKTIRVDVVRMLFVQNEMETATMVFFVLFTSWLSLLALKLIFVIFKNFGTFYKKVWIMIDLIITLMSVMTISMFLLRMRMVGNYLTRLEATKHNEFVSYFKLLYAEDFLTLFSGILVCMATVRLWKFLRFGQFFRVMERTLSTAAFPLFSVTFAFAIILTAFGFSGILIYGNEYPELSTFIKIVATLIQMALKPDQFDLSDYLDFQISYCYFSFYLIFMQVILLLYITVIIMAYVKAQLEFSVLPDRYTVVDYIREQIDYLPILARARLHRLRGGETDEMPPVTAKADEFRYANCIGIPSSRIKAMRFVMCCIVRNMNQSTKEKDELTDYEAQLMLGVCNMFVLRSYVEDDYELFFKGHFEGERVHLVDEARITKVAEFVKLMFIERSEEPTLAKSNINVVHCVGLIRKKNATLTNCVLHLKLMSFQFDAIDNLLYNLD